MTEIEQINTFMDELVAIRRDLHANPELGMEEYRTAEIVARYLESYGVEVHRGVGGTGVVGVLRSGNGSRSIGLRADMDALPMSEMTDHSFRSTVAGKMHACGHDGHTTMLLGAARHLATTRSFNGTVNFIFQPGEEGCGGALAMLEDGLFDRFPCDAIFGMHNQPGIDVGSFRIAPGAIAAGGGFFDITVTGKGTHAATAEDGTDSVLTACHIVTALQSIVSRNLPPQEASVLSVTRISGGDAYNVIPQQATIAGTARFFSRETGQFMEQAMKRVAQGVAAGFGATAELDFRLIFAPTVNDPVQTGIMANAAAAIVGEDKVDLNLKPELGSEDFSFMLEKVPGAYILLGNGEGHSLHHPSYGFNDDCIPYGAALYSRLASQLSNQNAGL